MGQGESQRAMTLLLITGVHSMDSQLFTLMDIFFTSPCATCPLSLVQSYPVNQYYHIHFMDICQVKQGICSRMSSPLVQWRPPRPQCLRARDSAQYPCPSSAPSPARSPVTAPPPPPRPPWCRPPAPTAARPLSPPSSHTSMEALLTHRTQVWY